MKFDNLRSEFGNKNILIWGMGIEGKSTFKFIRKILPTCHLTITDDVNVVIDDKNTTYLCTKDVCFDEYDCIIKSPGIVIDVHDFPFNKCTSQTEIFLKYYRKQVVGITGTKGKSTTSSLLYHILKSINDNVFLVGNIGVPCFDIIEELDDDSIVVFEISCHQLEYSHYSPHIAVLLNLYEEHIDHYGTYEKYIHAKENIYRYQDESDIAIINAMCSNQVIKTKHMWTCSLDKEGDIYVDEPFLIIPHNRCEIDFAKTPLVGHHNYYNMAIVFAIVNLFFHVTCEEFSNACATFSALSHRLQNIGNFKGVRYVDDSISTICQSTIQAIKSLADVDTVLIGGMDRGIEYDELVTFLMNSSVRNVIFMYASGKRIANLWKEKSSKNCYVVDDLESAVSLAKEITAVGTTCLLSPAAASYGYFKNFEERGNEFQRLVKETI